MSEPEKRFLSEAHKTGRGSQESPKEGVRVGLTPFQHRVVERAERLDQGGGAGPGQGEGRGQCKEEVGPA